MLSIKQKEIRNHFQLLASAFLLLTSAAHAAEWSFEPSVSGLISYDDNYRLTNTPTSSTEWSLKPSSDFSRRTETSTLTGSVDLDFRRFDDANLNTNDSRLTVNYDQQFSPLSRFGLNAQWNRDTTLDSELATTGLVLNRVRRSQKQLAPSYSHAFTERLSGTASLSAQQVRYARTTTGFNDYDYTTASGQLNWQYSPRTTFTGAVDLSRYETPDTLFQVDNRQLTVGLKSELTELMSLNTSAGMRSTDTRIKTGALDCPPGTVVDFISLFTGQLPCVDPVTGLRTSPIQVFNTTKTTNTGSVLSAELQRGTETNKLTATISRSVTPSATGLVNSSQIRLRLDHEFSEKLSGAFDLSWYRSTSKNSATTLNTPDSTFIRIQPSLNWQIDRQWRFTTNYRYSQVKRTGTLGTATSNALSLVLDYRWPKMAVSR